MPKKTKSIYKKTEDKAWKFYQDWAKTGSFSPAFQEKIFVTRYGWNHLVDPVKRRTKVQKIKRFNALPLAKKLIETSTTYQEHRFDHQINYYAFVAEMSGSRIKVVVSSKGKNKKIFLSIIVLK